MALTQEQIDYAKRVMDGGSTSVSSGPRTFDDFYKSVGKEIPGSKPLKPKMTTTQKVFSPITAPITGAKKLWDVASGVYGGIKNYFTGGGWEDRKEEFKQNMEMLKNTDQSKPEAMWKNISTGLSFIGDVIGTGTDLAAAGIIGGGKEIEPLRKGVESLLETELAQEGFKILSEKMEDWDAWKAENPYVANAIEGVINIAGAQTFLKATGGAVNVAKKTAQTAQSYADDIIKMGWKSTKDVARSFGRVADDLVGGTKALTSGVAGSVDDVFTGAKKLVGKVDDLEYAKPVLTKGETIREFASAGTKGKTIQKQTLLKGSEVLGSASDAKRVENVKSVIGSFTQNKVDDIVNINKGISNNADRLLKDLRKYNLPYNENQLTKNILALKDDIPFFGEEAPAYAKVVDEFLKIQTRNPKNLEGLWKSRMQLDQLIKQRYGESFFNSMKNPPLKQAIKDIRINIANAIEKANPDANFKKTMKLLEDMYNTRDILAEKAFLEKGASGIQQLIDKVTDLPILRTLKGSTKIIRP
jgi:hypothetical protein